MTSTRHKKILIISHDKIGANMAGPGIRYHYMATELSQHFDITVGFFDPSYLPDDSFSRGYDVRSIDSNHFQTDFNDFDTVIALYLTMDMLEFCKKEEIFIVFDIYAPVPVENLALSLFSGDAITRNVDFAHKQSGEMYRQFFKYGDLFLFSNRRQLDYWFGYIFGADQIRVSKYSERPIYDRFIYAPMGIDTKTTPKHSKRVIRGLIPGITDSDKVLLWTGGIYNWFDGKTLIKAMKRLAEARPDIKLVFFGTKHPNPDVPAMRESAETFELAKKLGLLNRTVFMNEGWVPYPERVNYLLESDLALSIAKDTFEAEFSHRTRVVDSHIYACLPTIATAGDYISDDILEPKGIGKVVPPYDDERLAEVIIEVLEPRAHKLYKKRLKEIRDEFDWSVTLKPLIDALKSDTPKLPFIDIPDSRAKPNTKLYRLGKRVLPRSVKKVILGVLRYGN